MSKEELQLRLRIVRAKLAQGIDVQRNRQRERYLLDRLHKLGDRDNE